MPPARAALLATLACVVAAGCWAANAVIASGRSIAVPRPSGIATTTEPVLAAALAWLLLGQALSPTQLIGGALVVAGVLLAQLVRQPGSKALPIEMAP